MTSNYQKIEKIILRLYQDEILKNRIIIVGGTVPYLVSRKESDRVHSDIDIIVRQEQMPFIREYLKKEELPMQDSLKLCYNRLHLDYGIDTLIDGVSVNFAPFEIDGNHIIQRNFLTKQNNGIDALATVTMKNLDISKVFIETTINDVTIHTYSLEMVKIMKEKSKQKKDIVDIKTIDEFGYSENNYSILKGQLKDMKFVIKPKNKLLRLFFH